MTMSGIPAKVGNCDWTINTKERTKYEQLFQSLSPENGYLPGSKVKNVLMDSKLPIDTLGQIWDLADMDKDGQLDKSEFIIAMHLVYKALENYAIPTVLPPELLKLKQEESTGTVKWVITPHDLEISNKLFTQADKDLDGFVSGLEVKDIFMQSNLNQKILAHVWNLCDIARSGKLNREQFALAMWLIKSTLRGQELPPSLSNEMIPPSFRPKTQETPVENNALPEYTNPELEMINNDIIDILKAKKLLEQDVAQKETDITIKKGEIKSLQSELDTLAATHKQLENQKVEAKKRLSDLAVQVNNLRSQADDQAVTLKVQLDELNSKKQEIESLRKEEQELERQQNAVKECLDDIANQSQKTQLQISQTKTAILHLQELYQQMFDAIQQYDAALATGQAIYVPDSILALEPDVAEVIRENIKDDAEKNSILEKHFPEALIKKDDFNNFNSKDEFNQGDDSFFKDKDAEPQVEDPFKDDPFAALHAPTTRSVSPGPALPPKQAKKPPPRPAPPKSNKIAALADEGDPFASKADPFASKGGDPFVGKGDPFAAKGDPFAAKGDPFASQDIGKSSGFADFANFDNGNQGGQVEGFSDDPFKDYRYDDPFLDNQDCFGDDSKSAKKF